MVFLVLIKSVFWLFHVPNSLGWSKRFDNLKSESELNFENYIWISSNCICIREQTISKHDIGVTIKCLLLYLSKNSNIFHIRNRTIRSFVVGVLMVFELESVENLLYPEPDTNTYELCVSRWYCNWNYERIYIMRN